jgi:predicted DNA-binding protein
MRTSIDIPDELYRRLKAHAAATGLTFRTLLLRLVDLGLQQQASARTAPKGRREPPPVIIAPGLGSIPALSAKALRQLEDEDDEAKSARSSRR